MKARVAEESKFCRNKSQLRTALTLMAWALSPKAEHRPRVTDRRPNEALPQKLADPPLLVGMDRQSVRAHREPLAHHRNPSVPLPAGVRQVFALRVRGRKGTGRSHKRRQTLLASQLPLMLSRPTLLPSKMTFRSSRIQVSPASFPLWSNLMTHVERHRPLQLGTCACVDNPSLD